MNEYLLKFLTFGMTTEQAKGFWLGLYRLVFVFAIGAGWGCFGFIGVPQFARAGDVEKRIEESSKEVLTKLSAQEYALKSTTELLNKQLASSVAAQIRSQAVRRCKAKTSADREAANREIDRLQEEYAEYRKTPYSLPNCEDL